ncbi:MAG: thiol-disulfide isomerase/thioredoxin [Kiritimatiellia bacterium]|jgi:thiol-disulfide isomerase/thioredoxin
MNYPSSIFCCIMLLVFTSCEPVPKKQAHPHLGNLADRSYGGLVTTSQNVQRISASGKPVSMAQFHGQFVWVDYAAPWCAPCKTQARVIKQLEHSMKGQVQFLTVMTSKSNNYDDVPDQQTAKAWAAKHGLSRDHVVVADNLWSRTIPAHILFSPEGQMLYRSTGGLNAAQIKAVVDQHLASWKASDLPAEAY